MLRSSVAIAWLLIISVTVGCYDSSGTSTTPTASSPTTQSADGADPTDDSNTATDAGGEGTAKTPDTESGDAASQVKDDETNDDPADDANATGAEASSGDDESQSGGGDAGENGAAETGADKTGADETPSGEVKDEAAGDDAGDKQSPAETQAESGPAFKSERVVLFTTKGPLVVEIQLSIDNKPHGEALDKLVQYVMTAADTNEDGKATWEELTENPKFMYGQLGNVELTSAGMRRNAIQLYDVIRNGRVDASEVPRFLTRNAGGSRSFAFRSANYYRDINRADSPLFQLLDQNEDGRVDYDEADRAALRIQSRDADADGVLLLDEISPSTDDRPGPLTQRRVSAPSASVWLSLKTKWANVLYAMEEQYMLGGSLGKSAFAFDPGLFDKLNQDEDDDIDKKELARLLEVAPHIKIEANFGERDEARETLSVTHVDPRLEAAGGTVITGVNRITIRLPDDRVLIFFKDEAQAVQVEQQAQALLTQYDADKNKYLDEDEFPEAAPGLMGGIEAYDADGDGKVYKQELTDYLANVRVAQRSQIHSRAGDLSDAFFDALDTSSDGRLDGREASAISERVRELDKDGDGELIIDEIPGSMALAVVRGDSQQSDRLFSIPVAQPTPPENAPRWFTRMDRNQDGAIAATEFLGETDQFAQLDANEDGFITTDEVPETKPAKSDKEAVAEPKDSKTEPDADAATASPEPVEESKLDPPTPDAEKPEATKPDSEKPAAEKK